MEAVVSCADAAFSSEIADRFEITSITLVRALLQESAQTRIFSVPSLDTSIPVLTSPNFILVSFSFSCCSFIRTSACFISSIVFWDSLISLLIICWISTAASFDCTASFWISVATTAKPLPASPALADSMEAFSDSRFVWDAMEVISSVATLIFLMDSSVRRICSPIIPIASEVLSLEALRFFMVSVDSSPALPIASDASVRLFTLVTISSITVPIWAICPEAF